jgi:hypothetical protein
MAEKNRFIRNCLHWKWVWAEEERVHKVKQRSLGWARKANEWMWKEEWNRKKKSPVKKQLKRSMPIQTEYNVEKTVSQRVSKNWWKYEQWEQIKSWMNFQWIQTSECRNGIIDDRNWKKLEQVEKQKNQ